MTSPPESVGSYHVLRPLSAGGAHDVLLAEDRAQHLVVLKILPPQPSTFARETAAYQRLVHPTVVQLHEVLPLDGGPVMVVEHVDGAPLRRVRGMLKAVGSDVDDVAAFHIVAEICSALAAAHAVRDDAGEQRPLVHRFLSPTAVLVGWDGCVKVGDFGAARTTQAKGAEGYMAPEQLSGREILPRSDVYAAALILWELLTHQRAFRRTRRRVDMWRAMAEPRIEPLDTLRPDVDATVRELVLRALEPRVEKRNITAREIASVLRGLVTAEDGRARVVELMAKVRHEPAPVVSDPPPPASPNLPAARSARTAEPAAPALPSIDIPAPTAQRPAVVAVTSTAAPATSAAAVALPAIEIERRSSAKLPAAAPQASGERPSARRTSSSKMPAVVIRRTSSTKMPAVTPPSPADAKKRAPLPPPPSDTAPTVPPPPAPRRDPSSFDLLPKALVVDLPSSAPPPPHPEAEVSVDVTASVVENRPSDEPGSVEVSLSAIAPLPAEETAPSTDDAPPPRRRRRGMFLLLAFVALALGVVVADRLGYVHLRIPSAGGSTTTLPSER